MPAPRFDSAAPPGDDGRVPPPDAAFDTAAATDALARALAVDRFVHVDAAAMLAHLRALGLADWDGFARSWDRLAPDRFMADGGRDRRRRHAVFRLAGPPDAPVIDRAPDAPHYQDRAHNPLNGGVARRFAPVEDATAAHPALRAILAAAHAAFAAATPPAERPPASRVELHQFRIEPTEGGAGRPTPEGVHRDGVDWVLVLLVRRDNVAEGETGMFDAARRPLGRFVLATPGEAVLLDDRAVFHGVTPVRPLDPARPAFRDVLVATFTAVPGAR